MDRINFTKKEILKIAKFFRLGYYRTNKEGQFLECDSWARGVFGIPEDEKEEDLPKHSIAKLYEIPADREQRIKMLMENKLRPFSDSISVLINGKTKLLFDVCWSDNQENIFGLVREMEESRLLRSVRAVERMPTGFYHVEHAENDEEHEHERITQCNDRFVQIHGFKKKEDAVGKSIVKLFHTPEKKEKFFKDLYEADKKGKPLLNYPFEIKRIDGKPIQLSIDVHLVKDDNGKVTGREGTIRDVTVEKELREEVQKTRERLAKTTTDIDKLIHTFLHPVVKFSSNAELLFQVSNLLQRTIQQEYSPISYGKKLGEEILEQLVEIKDNLPDIEKNLSYNEKQKTIQESEELLAASSLKDVLKKIINMFDYSLRTEKNKTLLDNTIKDTALWVLEEFQRVHYSSQKAIHSLIKKGFIELLHGILFDHLIHGVKILKEETEIMKREVEALRGYIGLREKRRISVMKCDLGVILKENIERFKPILSEKEVEIYYKRSGNLEAEISPNDIDRVICNLLHNAKKYSYSGPGRFVHVKAQELQPDNIVGISIASFGIPIKKEEIESGHIFEYGKRGELALKSDRDGTGVGLADAKEIIEAHGGELYLISKPAKGETETDPAQYKVPYLTKVLIRIPKKSRHREE